MGSRRARTAGRGWLPNKDPHRGQHRPPALCPPSAPHPRPAPQARRSPGPREKGPPPARWFQHLGQRRSVAPAGPEPPLRPLFKAGRGDPGKGSGQGGWGWSWVLGFRHHLLIHSLSSITLEPSLTPAGSQHPWAPSVSVSSSCPPDRMSRVRLLFPACAAQAPSQPRSCLLQRPLSGGAVPTAVPLGLVSAQQPGRALSR